MNITVRPNMLNLLGASCYAGCGNKAQLQIEFPNPIVRIRMCDRCYAELQSAMSITLNAVAKEHIEHLESTLRECRDVADPYVMLLIDNALKEMNDNG